MRVYHFGAANWQLENIRERRLKVVEIDKVNDPFEFFGVASDEKEIRRRYTKLKRDLAKTTGLLCFSASWRNPVHWGIYADSHKGICLGFDVPNRHLHKVNYVDDRIPADAKALEVYGPAAREHTRALITTKYRHWEYEQEHRQFIPLENRGDKDLFWCPFSDDLRLREVILGAAGSETSERVRSALGDLDTSVAITTARPSFGTFSMVKQRAPSLQR